MAITEEDATIKHITFGIGDTPKQFEDKPTGATIPYNAESVRHLNYSSAN